ncbi:N-formylglutamate amidohydrolase [Oecophyllibacter saccharovorans]|uniref:N-formylglutamate deformylase n=1 Tax=Oecophyllibacter saccharovorans TaxID=2558360 RepID=A0A506UQH1_9PROT|nr:N-formylglutamate amidohydrolase [Oecophyllibacter saccharovorans]TPW35597.1 N-formylglutamate deformylase [Oecophyllibacter saccharovorans]
MWQVIPVKKSTAPPFSEHFPTGLQNWPQETRRFDHFLKAYPDILGGQKGNSVHLSPCLLSSPHSGRDYLSSFLSTAQLPLYALQHMEDRFVDDLVAELPGYGMSLLHARFPRSYCDPNRNWRELDPNMFRPSLDPDFVAEALTWSERVAAGFGVVPRCVQVGRPIYRHCLEPDDAFHRLNHYWHPYHQALQGLQQEITESFGLSVLLDMHSMPPSPQYADADIILGDAFGQSCAPELADKVEALFQQAGYRVRRNRPYSGGYITRAYGHPDQGRHALQIEISRKLYLNPTTLAPSSRYSALKETLTTLLAQIGQWTLSPAANEALRPAVCAAGLQVQPQTRQKAYL